MSPIKREVHIGDCRLILGDCLDVLPLLGGGMAVVSDPPYGINYQRGPGGRGWPNSREKVEKRNDAPVVGDGVPFEPETFLHFENVILWGANHFAQRLPHGRWLAWDKLAGITAFDDFSDVEFAWRNGRGKDRVFSYRWKGLLKQASARGEARIHPTQKPVALMAWCIDMLPAEADVIFDPFMGSGTTGVACVKLGRKFIGIEIDEGYFDIACQRIADTVARPDLFIEAERTAEPKQEALEL